MPGRTADTAELITESARASCRLQTGWIWARRASVTDPGVRRAVLELALAVGDASLVERLVVTEAGAGPPPATVHASWPGGIPTSIDAPALLAAELWRRADRPRRALTLAKPLSDPWARIVEALAATALREPQVARAALAQVPAGHPAEAWRLTLSLGLGDVRPVVLQRWVDAHPDSASSVAEAAAELYHLPGVNTDLIQVRGLRLHGDAPSPDEVVRLPGEPSEALERVVAQRAIRTMLDVGHRAEARHLAQVWSERRPTEVDAWLARAESDAEHANAWLDKALELSPCHAEALLLSAHHAPVPEQVSWLRRAQEAAPLSQKVQQALSRRGLGAR